MPSLIIGYHSHSRASYWDNFTVYPYYGCIKSTNPVVRHYVTNLYPETNTCKLWRSKICQNITYTRGVTFTFTVLKRASLSTKSVTNPLAQEGSHLASWIIIAPSSQYSFFATYPGSVFPPLNIYMEVKMCGCRHLLDFHFRQ